MQINFCATRTGDPTNLGTAIEKAVQSWKEKLFNKEPDEALMVIDTYTPSSKKDEEETIAKLDAERKRLENDIEGIKAHNNNLKEEGKRLEKSNRQKFYEHALTAIVANKY